MPVTVIGLTGGIASGKSTVCKMLAKEGVVTIDADKIGHTIYDKGTEAFTQVSA
jgi:dephospho-CoA kinase